MDPNLGIWIAAVGGSLIGVAGGLVGTYFSIRNTNGPRERRFMVRAAVVAWLAIGSFLAALFFTPLPYRALLWIPYAILLTLAIRTANRAQARIRQEESTS